jgi:hypothetical protein
MGLGGLHERSLSPSDKVHAEVKFAKRTFDQPVGIGHIMPSFFRYLAMSVFK